MDTNCIGENGLVKCFVVCVYFVENPEKPFHSAFALADSLGKLFSIDHGVRVDGVVQTVSDRELLETRDIKCFKKVKFKSNQIDLVNSVGSHVIPSGKEFFVAIELGRSRMMGRDKIYPVRVRYNDNDGWDKISEDNFGGPSLTVSVCKELVESNILFDELMCCILSEAESFGEVCHGVVDHDYFLANFNGLFYDGNLFSPCLAERAASQYGWASVGGVKRIELCRDPREAVIFGASIVQKLALGTDQGVRDWISRHDFGSHEPRVLFPATGSVVIMAAEDPLDFQQTVRKSMKSRVVSEKIFNALCKDGFSDISYKIKHVKDLVLVDGF